VCARACVCVWVYLSTGNLVMVTVAPSDAAHDPICPKKKKRERACVCLCVFVCAHPRKKECVYVCVCVRV